MSTTLPLVSEILYQPTLIAHHERLGTRPLQVTAALGAVGRLTPC